MSERFFAVCPPGLEPALAAELTALGAGQVKAAAAGVSFAGSMSLGYAANLHSRLASRVLWHRASGPIRDEHDLHALARSLAWERDFDAGQSLRVDLTAHRSPLQSLQFASLRVKDGVVDRLRERTGRRPDIDRAQPAVRVMAHLEAAQAHLYLDLSGEPLFKRGWRTRAGESPLKENLAAGLLALSGWEAAQALLDPFCGSGTIAIEAAARACGRAPGIARHFAFERLRSFDTAAWSRLQQEARASQAPRLPAPILARDVDPRMVALAQSLAREAGLGQLLDAGDLRFETGDAREALPHAPGGQIVSNPPYGERSAPQDGEVAELMAGFASQLKQQFSGWQAWLLTADRGLPGQMRLRESRKVPLTNGDLDCRLFRFDMVAGSARRN